MRRFIIALPIGIGILLLWTGYWATLRRESPPVTGIQIDCAQIIEHRRPDHEWPGSARRDSVATVGDAMTLGAYDGKWVAVRGVLHIQFGTALVHSTRDEWFALFLAWPAPAQARPEEGLLLRLATLEPGEAFWAANEEQISGRCAVVEGLFDASRAKGPLLGELNPVRRLAVLSEPHRRLLVEPLRRGVEPPLIQ